MTGQLATEPVELTAEARAHGWRLDHYLRRMFPNYSRALLQKAIEQGGVEVNGLPAKPSRRLRVNDRLSVRLPELPDTRLQPENLPLEILYEDESLVVVNKAAGMIVHPGRGNSRGTLAAALQFHFDQLSSMAGRLRPGIIHRLDRDTTGVLVVAKDNQVHHRLSRQFEQREVHKEYQALVWGLVDRDSDYIETHLRVHPKQREKMQVCQPGGKARQAVTFYEVQQRFARFTWVKLIPKTGRTHQLRVHLQHLGHPIVADRLYGGGAALDRWQIIGGLSGEPKVSASGDRPAETGRSLIERQALHASRLEFCHPESGQPMRFEAPLADDMQAVLDVLRT